MLDTTLALIAPAHCRYIKLGPGGAWEAAALDQGRLYWGTDGDDHHAGEVGDWDGARRGYITAGAQPGTATSWRRELRDFYTLGRDTLWITFARDHLWWAFAEPEVVLVGAATKTEGTRYRRTIGPWRSTDLAGW